jgi:hypothetical protein
MPSYAMCGGSSAHHAHGVGKVTFLILIALPFLASLSSSRFMVLAPFVDLDPSLIAVPTTLEP